MQFEKHKIYSISLFTAKLQQIEYETSLKKNLVVDTYNLRNKTLKKNKKTNIMKGRNPKKKLIETRSNVNTEFSDEVMQSIQDK